MFRWYYVPVLLLMAAVTAWLFVPAASADPEPQPLVGQILYVSTDVVAVQPVPPGLVTRESVSTNAQTRCYVDGSLATLGNLRVGMMAQIFPGKGLAKEIWATTSP